MSVQGKLMSEGELYEAINKKIGKPETAGTVGQVLGLDNNLTPTWIDQTGGGSDYPSGGSAGDILAKRTNADNDVEWITPASTPEQDNTRPITAAAVYTAVGNINALLATI